MGRPLPSGVYGAAFSANEQGAMAFGSGAVIVALAYHRGIRRFRTGAALQDFVQIARTHRRNQLCRLECLIVGGIECGGVIQSIELILDRFIDRLAIVSSADAAQAGDAIGLA